MCICISTTRLSYLALMFSISSFEIGIFLKVIFLKLMLSNFSFFRKKTNDSKMFWGNFFFDKIV